MTEQEILDNKPNEANQVDFEGDYWLLSEDDSSQCFLDGVLDYIPVQEPLRSISDIETIVALRAENEKLKSALHEIGEMAEEGKLEFYTVCNIVESVLEQSENIHG